MGYFEGKNIFFESRWAEGKVDRLPGFAAELVRLNVDVIVASTQVGIRAAQNETKTIPIVMMGIGVDPVEAGLIASLARPGGNTTGLTAIYQELSGKRLELLKEAFPSVSRVAVLWNPDLPGPRVGFKQIEMAAAAYGLKLQSIELRPPYDLEKPFSAITKKHVDALIVVQFPFDDGQRKKLIDLCVKSGLPADPTIRAAMNATKTIPIVMSGGGADPVKAGLVQSLARPGGNVTGVTLLVIELGDKRLELLKEAVPKISRLAVLYELGNPGSILELKEVLPAAARALGLTIRPWEVRSADGFEKVFAALNKQRPDALYVSTGALMNTNQKRIVSFALKSRLPSVYGRREYVDNGGLIYYGADLANSYRRVAYYVDKILKGAKPADLPVEQSTKFELVINLKTANEIGLTIPQSLLYRADRVIR